MKFDFTTIMDRKGKDALAVDKIPYKDVQVQDVAEYEEGLYARMAAQHNDVLDAIRTTGQLSAETEAALKAALTDYTRDFLKTKA